ncbi:MAG: hypothetical protein KatS3mg129_0897 [Leptospiraceae bacterium]|nr:MAG: hypothetical protein KatS3mg129_0897 [Leptospiraceae bacterium]
MKKQFNLNILIIHRDKNILKELKNVFKNNHYNVFTARKSEFALYLQKKINPEIVLTSLNPNGIIKKEALLKAITDVRDSPILILLEENDEEIKNINLLEYKIFETIKINKNIKETIIPIIESAKNYYIEKHNLFQYLQEYQQTWKKQIEWYLWKEYHKTIYRTNFSKKLIENIRNSLLQGLGLSSLISYVDLMDLKKIEQDDNILIPKTYFNHLKNNIEKLNLWIQNLENLLNYMNRSFEIEELDYMDFQKIIYPTILQIEEFRMIKKQEFYIGNLYFKGKVKANREALILILKEIFINAFKYSPEKSNIDLVIFDQNDKIIIAILNDILEFKGGITGIPEEYENQIFEPFVRLNHHFDERFLHEDFSLGTGLTIIKLYLQYFQGQIYLKEIMDYTREPKKRIMCGVILQK